jgi:hypothetical protein
MYTQYAVKLFVSFVLVFDVFTCVAYTCDPSDLADKDHAYQVCKNSSVCTKLFQLNGGGTDITMWNFLIVHNGGAIPESGGC